MVPTRVLKMSMDSDGLEVFPRNLTASEQRFGTPCTIDHKCQLGGRVMHGTGDHVEVKSQLSDTNDTWDWGPCSGEVPVE